MIIHLPFIFILDLYAYLFFLIYLKRDYINKKTSSRGIFVEIINVFYFLF